MNFNESAGQIYAFGLMAACGIVLCLVYDGFAAVRRRFGRWYVTVPCDLAFCAVAFTLYFGCHYLANYCKLSPFLLLAAGLGFALCKISLSGIVAKGASLLYNLCRKTSAKLDAFAKKHRRAALPEACASPEGEAAPRPVRKGINPPKRGK